MKTYTVYILVCSDNSYYTGITNNLYRRIGEHDHGYKTSCYTYSRRPLKLVYTQAFHFAEQAIAFEKQIKGWTRAKKEALIRGDIDVLKLLAVRKNN